ncbi:MAG: DUF2950 family protein [Planctomycetota bacterium]
MRCTLLTIAVVALSAAGCQSTGGDLSPDGFESPDAAFAALAAASRDESRAALDDLLGPRSDEVLATGDTVALQSEIEAFLELYDTSHSVEVQADGRAFLLVGGDEWTYPVPVVRDGDVWRFDVDRGIEEILDRRIGANELTATQVCRAIGDAQDEYRDLAPEGSAQFAARFFSDPGRRNGLYWPSDEGEALSPLGLLVARAEIEGYGRNRDGEPTPYHGYHYRILSAAGPNAPGGARTYAADGAMTEGHAVVAWPSAYGVSGVCTFLYDDRGILYECDLGPNTEAIVDGIDTFDPGPTWTVCLDG